MRFAKTILPICLLAVLVFSSYSNTFNSPPILDDFHTFVDVSTVHIKHLTVSNLVSLSKTTFGWTRWIPMITFALDFLWGKGEISYFHVTNIMIHVACMLAVLLLIFQIVKVALWEEKQQRFGSCLFFALAVSGLWALNPVQTNAVTYLVQRMASLEALFYILAVALYVLGRRSYHSSLSTWRTLLCFAGCVLSACGAFLSKENSAMLPVMLLITEWWFFRPNLPQQIWNHCKQSRRALQFLYILIILLTGIFFLHAFDHVIQGYQKRYFTLQQRLLTEPRIVLWYLSLLILPLPSRLSIEHDVNLSTSFFHPPTTLLAILFWIGLVLVCVRSRNRYPVMTYGIIWFVVNLLIESTFVPLELVFGHRLYVPSIGFFLFFVAAFLKALNYGFVRFSSVELAKLGWSTMAILCSCLALLTFERNMAWQNAVTINADAAAKAPQNPRAHANLAVAYARAGRERDAIREAELAIKLGRPRYEAYTIAANIIVGSLVALGNTRTAISRGDALLKGFLPSYDASGLPDFCLNLAQAHLDINQVRGAYQAAFQGLQYASRMNRNDHALMQIEGMMTKIVDRAGREKVDLDGDGRPDPGAVPVRAWIAKRFLAIDQVGAARALLEQVLRNDPHQYAAQVMLDSIKKREDLNRIQQAKTNFTDKYVYHPFSKFNFCMATAFLIQKKRLPDPLLNLGEVLVQHAIQLQPRNPDARLLLGWYFYGKGEVGQALRSARQALKLDPDNAKSWLGLGFFLVKANQPQAAVDAFHKALALYPGYRKRRVILQLASSLQKDVPEKTQASGTLHRS